MSRSFEMESWNVGVGVCIFRSEALLKVENEAIHVWHDIHFIKKEGPEFPMLSIESFVVYYYYLERL